MTMSVDVEEFQMRRKRQVECVEMDGMIRVRLGHPEWSIQQ